MIDFRSVRETRASAFDFIQVRIASPEEIRGPKDPKERERLEMAGAAQLVVVGRGDQARDHQLPLVQAGEGRPVLRAHLRSGQGLGMPLRQVQAHPLSRRDLRPLRRRSDPVARCAASAWATSSSPFPSRTSGSSRPCRARWATCSTSRCVISRRSSTTRTTSSSTRASRKSRTNQLLDEDEYLEPQARRRRKRATPRSSPTSARPRCASCSAASTSTSSPTSSARRWSTRRRSIARSSCSSGSRSSTRSATRATRATCATSRSG